jgi:erythromycin esterase
MKTWGDGMDAYSQEIKRGSIPFRSVEDLRPLIDRVKDKRVVMIGESSHGTHEFYEWRSAISQELITNHGFQFVAVEGDWPACEELGQFISRRTHKTLKQAMAAFSRWPTWMWANEEVARFSEWARREENPVGFHGLDVYSLFDSMSRVIEQVEKIDPGLAAQAREYYACFEPFQQNEKQYLQSLFKLDEGCREEAISALQKILVYQVSRIEKTDRDLFDAIQNARIVVNAEEYYRAMLKGDSESWNVRDRHMMDTLTLLMNHYGPQSKCIVWAHNTHIGDYRATDMVRWGQVNIGGLAREQLGVKDVALIGFGTYRGSVIASRAWDGPTQVMAVPEAPPETVEEECHQVCRELKCDHFYFHSDQEAKVGSLSEVRGHRAIGVLYDPKRERYGNYVPTLLAKRYDEFLFIDETRALEPMISEADHEKMPDTWPSAG